MRRRAIVLLALATALEAHAKDSLPDWMKKAAESPAAKTKRGATVLLAEREVTVREDGRLTIVERGAVRVTSAVGKPWAAVRVVYETGSDKVKDLVAWVDHEGEVRRLGKDQAVDVALSLNDVFNEGRARAISAADEVSAGDLFGWEWTLESRPLFGQLEWSFQDTLAVGVARFRLTLPARWSLVPAILNHAPVAPSAEGAATRWELRGLPEVGEEPLQPPASSLEPRIAVRYSPPAGAAPEFGRDFASWGDVARWMASLADGAPPASAAALEARAKELTAAAKTPRERVEALCRYVQGVKYISIQTGLGRGGGYKPHDPAEVLAKGYGDCKDKSNLLRGLLRAAGVKAWLVGLYSGDAEYVRAEWVTPQQFNHCIVAIEAGAGLAPTFEDGALGPVTLFDPTAEAVPLGELPPEDEGGLALLLAPEAAGLHRVPPCPAARNVLDRRVEAELAPDGTLKVRLHDERSGPSAIALRVARRTNDASDVRAGVEAWLSRKAPGARVVSSGYEERTASGGASLDAAFEIPRRAQKLPGGLLVIPSGVVDSLEIPALGRDPRRVPFVLEGRTYHETFRLKIPDGIAVDELPAPADLDGPYGRFTLAAKAEGGAVVVTRTLELKSGTHGPEALDPLRAFLAKVRAGLDTPLVLKGKEGSAPRA